jgi:hypothetical protein
MAFTRAATSDTDPKVQTRAYGSLRPPRGVTPLTGRTATSGRLPTGRTALTFSPLNVPQPPRTAPPPDVASEGRTIRRGKQKPFGNSIGNSIKGAAELLSPLIADAFSETGPSSGAFSALGFQPSGLTNVGQGSFGADFGSVPTTPFPVGDAGAFIGALNEGGFVRKRT